MSQFGDNLKVNTMSDELDILTMQDNDKDPDGNGPEDDLYAVTATRPKPKKPSLYRVLLLNDDYTPMEFVIHVLEHFFQKDREAATRIMLQVSAGSLLMRLQNPK
jgi:ATP-dependent Clp protease adaptor protein ClpS